MIILGIHEGHEAHACVVRDGALVSAIAEERLSRIKTDSRYPRRAIDAALRIAGVAPEEIDAVAFASKSDWLWQTLYNKHARYSVKDWIDECEIYWKPRLLEGKEVSPFEIADRYIAYGGPDVEREPYFPFLEEARNSDPAEWGAIGDRFRQQTIKDHLGLDPEKIHMFRHEDCHKAYGFYSSPYDRDDALMLTIEGGGDDSSATVSTISADGAFEEHWRSNDVQLGRLYAYVTLILGMKPGQHEYKVMGLAPYGTEYHGKKSLEVFRQVNHVEGIEIVNDRKFPDLYFSIRDALEGARFDGIAWGLQTWAEELLGEWVRNTATHFGRRKVILSGGVAQNIKATKALAELPEVDWVWAGPISGDGSLGIGAAWMAARKLAPTQDIERLKSVYLGTQYGPEAVERAIQSAGLPSQFQIVQKPSTDDVAQWIADGNVVARFSGRMEFGQRALGNRSILADPRHFAVVDKINQKIKYRDFWMPFTPSMTFEAAEKLLVNPKNLYSPFMTMAFDLIPGAADELKAVVHPSDKTARPQMLKREDNPGYYDLLKALGRRIGVECVMNTSFNLHGEAIVESPEDAIRTFLESEIDVLLFDDVAVSRVAIEKMAAA